MSAYTSYYQTREEEHFFYFGYFTLFLANACYCVDYIDELIMIFVSMSRRILFRKDFTYFEDLLLESFNDLLEEIRRALDNINEYYFFGGGTFDVSLLTI